MLDSKLAFLSVGWLDSVADDYLSTEIFCFLLNLKDFSNFILKLERGKQGLLIPLTFLKNQHILPKESAGLCLADP